MLGRFGCNRADVTSKPILLPDMLSVLCTSSCVFHRGTICHSLQRGFGGLKGLMKVESSSKAAIHAED